MNTESKIFLGKFLTDKNSFHLFLYLLMWANGRDDKGLAIHPALGVSAEVLQHISENMEENEQIALVLLALITVRQENINFQ